ncbi:MAG: hypothetical protein A2Y33_04060 [Spirochaetes bacterium GWF1_51_8]|nr:MAG: hypothetical protein A2Y33_04060 [Spirochaetes bacterium GWF1_51_8]
MKRLFLLYGLLFLSLPLVFADKKDFKFEQVPDYYRYKEEFLQIFNQWLYADQDNISRNIFFLEAAFCVPFDDPIKALVPITDPNQYKKYQNLVMMHISRLLTQAYIDYGYLFMKEHIYFFNHEFLTNYIEGYDIAEFYFGEARKYWNIAIDYAQKADAYKGYKINLSMYGYHFDFEDELYKIKTGLLNYHKVIDNLMYRIDRNRKTIQGLFEQYQQ